MKKIFKLQFLFPVFLTALLLAVFNTATFAQPCSMSNITLNSQADVDNFQANYGPCTTLHNLTIEGADISDLTPLSSITSLSGGLLIDNCDILTSLDGLNIESVLGLRVRRNPMLADLDALSKLLTVSGSNLTISNTLATDLDFLSNITSAFRLTIVKNSLLTNIDGLSGITSVYTCSINGNTVLPNIDGLSNLTTVTGLDFIVFDNPALENIDGLSGLTTLPDSRIYIYNNASLTNLNGLSNLTSLGSGLLIMGNPLLTNLNGLSNLNTLGNRLTIRNNPLLTDCCIIENFINTPGLFVLIENNQTGCDNQSEISTYCADADMDSFRPIDGDCDDNNGSVFPGATEICDGIDNDCDGQTDEGLAVYNGNIMFTTQAQLDAWSSCVTTINGSVMISGYNITDLTPLANIQSITGNLNIQYTGLASLSGLDNLQSVGGTVTILFNSSLSSLYGLHNLTAVSGSLMLYYNFQLSDCCDITDLLNNGGVTGARVIYFNASGCNSQAEILAQCQIQNLTSNPNSGANNLDVAISSQTNEMQEAQLFPNPAKDLVNLRLAKSFDQGRLEIFDAQGRSVNQQKLTANMLQYQIETVAFSPGLYFVKIETDGETSMHKLVIE